MSELELRLETLKYLLFNVDFYKDLISKEGYEKLNTGKYNKKLGSLRSAIESDINYTSSELEINGIKYPQKDFSLKEVKIFKMNTPEIKSLFKTLKTISMDIYKESNCIEMDFMTQLDFPPEWIFPTSTASVNNDSDIIIESSLKNHLSNFSVDDLFIKVIDIS